ncbi:MAG: hypothetical protein WB995_10640 [Candidatus Acidiferrales bacterium]
MKSTSLIVSAAAIFALATTGAQHITALRQIDFKNFTYAWNDEPQDVPETWHWLTSPTKMRVRTINGIHHFHNADLDDTVPAPRISVDDVAYGDLDGDGVEEAAVTLNYGTGGTANWSYLYVYKLQAERPMLLARLQAGSRADDGLIKASIRDGVLILDFNDPERRVGDCCSEGYIRVHYRWREGRFIEQGRRERGNTNLRPVPLSPVPN